MSSPKASPSAQLGRRCDCTPLKAVRIATCTVCVLSVVVVFIAAGALGFLRSHTLPNLSLPLSVGAGAGLSQKAYFFREDTTGILHISAQTEADLFFAQGFGHAQRRMWQMEFQRRVGAGRLAEVAGSAALDVDRTMRTLGMYRAAQAALPALSNHSRAVLQSYANGVNAYMAGMARGDYAKPLELYLLGDYELEPWTPADSAVWAKLMSYSLSGNMDREMTRYKLAVQRNLSVARVYQLLPNFDTSRFVTVLSAADVAAPYFPNGSVTAKAPTAPAQAHADSLARAEEEAVAALERELPIADPVLAAMEKARELEAAMLSRAPAASARGAGARAARRAAAQPACDAASAARLAASLLRRQTAAAPASAPPADESAAAESAADAEVAAAVASGFDMPSLFTRGFSGTTLLGRYRGIPGGGARASNNWVVGGNLTASGLPLLCNDPHLQLMAPSIWLLNHLHAPAAGYEVHGASFVGIPGVVLGRNAHIAWAVTNTGADVQDLYMMQEQPGNASFYLYNGAYVPYDTRQEVIKVKGAADVVITVRTSAYGPVVTDNGVFDGIAQPMSLRWVSTDPSIPDTTLDAFLDMNVATNYSDWRNALRRYIAPSQNFIFADTQGNIGYQMSGWVPVRNASGGYTGAWPSPGTGSPAFDWRGRIPFDAMPATLNPPEGFIASANNRVVPVNYSMFITADWDEPSAGYRAERITDMIKAAAPRSHTVASMQGIQQDYTSYFARDMVSIAAALPASAFRTTGGAGLQARFAAWDHEMGIGSGTATLFAEVWQRLATLGTAETGGQYWGNNVFLWNALRSDATPAGTDPACINAGASRTLRRSCMKGCPFWMRSWRLRWGS